MDLDLAVDPGWVIGLFLAQLRTAVFVIADGPERVDGVRDRTLAFLRDDSDAASLVAPNVEFVAQTNEELLDQVRDILDTLTAFVTGVAVISLVVGAIGIANVTLVTVMERTGEIGLRRAMGARRRHIAAQFLCESAAMGLVGGIVGASVGLVVVVAVSASRDWTPLLDAWLPIAAPPVGALVGLIAGLYPSLRAARMEPVEALRTSL